jgi:hypothetical protein
MGKQNKIIKKDKKGAYRKLGSVGEGETTPQARE